MEEAAQILEIETFIPLLLQVRINFIFLNNYLIPYQTVPYFGRTKIQARAIFWAKMQKTHIFFSFLKTFASKTKTFSNRMACRLRGEKLNYKSVAVCC